MLSTKRLTSIGKGAFSFPKPTKLLARLIDATTTQDALILDFFAGSGTTAHAVLKLNAEDGGTRQCILVTNNEVDAKQQKQLLADGYQPGSPGGKQAECSTGLPNPASRALSRVNVLTERNTNTVRPPRTSTITT